MRRLTGATIEKSDGGYFWKYKEFTSITEDNQVYDEPEYCIVRLVSWLIGRLEAVEVTFADYREYVKKNYLKRPKKKTQLFKSGQVEEYQLGTDELEEMECPTCDGSGEYTTEFEGIEDADVCRDCHGAGVLYISID